MFFPWGLASQRWPITDLHGGAGLSRPPQLERGKGLFPAVLGWLLYREPGLFHLARYQRGSFSHALLPGAFPVLLFNVQRSRYSGLPCGPCASLRGCCPALRSACCCVPSGGFLSLGCFPCRRWHCSMGCFPMHPRFLAILGDFSGFFWGYLRLSHSISLFRDFSNFLQWGVSGAVWGCRSGQGVPVLSGDTLRCVDSLRLSAAFLGEGCYYYLPPAPSPSVDSWGPPA